MLDAGADGAEPSNLKSSCSSFGSSTLWLSNPLFTSSWSIHAFILETCMNFLSSHIAYSSLNLSIKGTFPAYLIEVSLSTLLSYPKHLCFFISSLASFNLKERLTFLPIFGLLDNSYSTILSFFRLFSLFHCNSSFWLFPKMHKNIWSRGEQTHSQKWKGPA